MRLELPSMPFIEAASRRCVSDKSSGHSHMKADIYFTAVGMIDIPAEKEILATMEEMRNNPQDFKFVA